MRLVLVLGTSQNNFKSFLYGKIKEKFPSFLFTNPFISEINDGKVNDWMYDNAKIQFKKSFFSYLQSTFSLLFSKIHLQIFFYILFIERKTTKAFHFIFISIKEKAFFLANRNFEIYDVFHFHYLQYSYLREIFLIPASKKIVCTFWGSDLLRTGDTFNHFIVKKALEKANVITCQTAEMKEIILSKYGRNLREKIVIVKFIIPKEVFVQIDNFSYDQFGIDSFKEKYRLPSEKKIVVIGHSGSPENNHLAVIKSLESFQHKDKVHFMINLNYATGGEKYEYYRNEIENFALAIGLDFSINENFFSGKDLALSRIITDVFIHVPSSDALSATLTEMVYSGAEIITGKWLSYNTFRELKLLDYEINDFDEISHYLSQILEAKKENNLNLSVKKTKIQQCFLNDEIVQQWTKILE